MLEEKKVRENWRFIEKRNKEAKRDGYWIEAMSLSYMMLEVAFWVLLEKKEVSEGEVDKQRFLIDLAKFARDKGYINGYIYERVQKVNKTRGLIIHQFARGKISYEKGIFEPALRGVDQLFHDITKMRE